jgi:CBS domain containing-hemolysin-like protein
VIDPNLWLFVLLVSFLVLDLLVSAARGALSSISLPRLLTLKDEWGERVAGLLRMLDDSRRHLAGLYILQMLLRFLILGSVFAILYALQLFPRGSLLLEVLVILAAAILIAWLEWMLAALASRTPELWALRLEPFVRLSSLLMLPLTILPLTIMREANGKVQSVLRVTEAELKTMVDAGEQEGLIEQEERKMIYSIFDLGETLAREIMVPRIDVLALEINTPLDKAINALLDSGYSRVPVFNETIDNVLGLLYAKDLLSAWHSGSEVSSLAELLREAYFIPEAKKVDELLAEMQARRIHVAIVVDEYGGVAGLVTLEDIVEEIVGEIRDEYDLREEAFYQEISPDEYVCSGRMDLDDFNELLNVELPVEDADTLGGYIYSRIGRVPTGGESIEAEGLVMTIEQVSKRRIRKVRIKRVPPPVDEEVEESHART